MLTARSAATVGFGNDWTDSEMARFETFGGLRAYRLLQNNQMLPRSCLQCSRP
jgi:hypothetical protein